MPNAQGQTYVTVDGDVLDAIVWRIYGRGADAVRHVLAANPQIRHAPQVFSAGIEINLPELPEPEPRGRIVLWE